MRVFWTVIRTGTGSEARHGQVDYWSHLVVADSWASRGTFKPERHLLQLRESAWTQVQAVRQRRAESSKPFTLYSCRLDPYPGFLVNGHLARQPW